MDLGLDCVNETDSLTDLNSPGTVATIVALGMVNLAVVLGNSLVVVSVITTRKLRTVTNIFIVSLACADLLLGFAVLPFSIYVEIVKMWQWGTVWCSMWLAIDVWLCTASILSLCAISLDRYIAVTRPIRYPSIVSPVRGKVVVMGVWVLSFVICLPPLVGWNETSETTLAPTTTESTETLNESMFMYMDSAHDIPVTMTTDFMLNFTEEEMIYTGLMLSNKTHSCVVDAITCELTPTKGYRIYAAMGSFFIPMLVMVFFYLRIYLAAMRTASSLRKGVLTTRTSNELAQHNGHDDSIQLRIHRGGSTSSSQYSYMRGNDSLRYQHYQNGVTKTPIRSPKTLSPHLGNNHMSGSRNSSMKEPGKNNNYPEKNSNGGSVIFMRQFNKARSDMQSPFNRRKHDDSELETLNPTRGNKCHTGKHAVQNGIECDLPSSSSSDMRHRRCKLLIKDSKSSVNAKGHARKFRRETKAAKTLAIIVGAFIICWFPFFTIYLLGAFCQDCVSDIVFSVFFWLGYCNSALNPCIYALFARDFRFAFKRLLSCKRRRGFSNATRAEFVTGTRKALSPIAQEGDSLSDY